MGALAGTPEPHGLCTDHTAWRCHSGASQRALSCHELSRPHRLHPSLVRLPTPSRGSCLGLSPALRPEGWKKSRCHNRAPVVLSSPLAYPPSEEQALGRRGPRDPKGAVEPRGAQPAARSSPRPGQPHPRSTPAPTSGSWSHLQLPRGWPSPGRPAHPDFQYGVLYTLCQGRGVSFYSSPSWARSREQSWEHACVFESSGKGVGRWGWGVTLSTGGQEGLEPGCVTAARSVCHPHVQSHLSLSPDLSFGKITLMGFFFPFRNKDLWRNWQIAVDN